MDSYAGENEPKVGSGVGSHVLLLPYPSQGHVHPMLQFGKRLAYYGLRPTLAVTRFILATCAPGDAAARRGGVRLAAVSDGFDRGGFGECGDVAAYLSRLEAAGSETLGELLEDEAARGRPVRAVVYDAFLPVGAGRGAAARRPGRGLLHAAVRRQRGVRARVAPPAARAGGRGAPAPWAAGARPGWPAVVPQGRDRPVPGLLRDGRPPVPGAGASRRRACQLLLL